MSNDQSPARRLVEATTGARAPADRGIGLLGRALRWGYNQTVRQWSPPGIAVYNSVAVQNVRAADWFQGNETYKHGLAEAIRERVGETDRVVEVGAGRGVMTTIAARRAQRVIAYEAGDEYLTLARDTVERNHMADRAMVRHAIVGTPGAEVWGEESGAVVAPADLPRHDVLVLDCEGAEVDIIPGLTARPRAIIVEPHPEWGVDEHDVVEVVEAQGYDIVNSRRYEPDDPGKAILVAERDSDE